MRRYLFIVLTLVFALGVGISLSHRMQAQAALPQLTSGQTLTRSIPQATKDEYLKMVKSNASEGALQSWARTNKLEVVRLAPNRLIIVPEVPPVDATTEEVGVCDARNCPTGSLAYTVTNTAGKQVGVQVQTCKAGSCKWVHNPITKGWTRMCGSWSCTNSQFVAQ
jgi:hypothetical protein